MNPRIQVEHTVTEEVTDVDLVQSQLRIAAGETLTDLGLEQDDIRAARRGPAVPHHDRGPGQRVPSRHRQASRPTARPAAPASGSTAAPPYAGAEISAHFDSMLVKLTCRGRDFPTAVAEPAGRSPSSGSAACTTNIPFLQAVLAEPDFCAGA